MEFSDVLASGRGGDSAALDHLFGRWRPLLRLQASRLLGSELVARVDPSDVVQEALTQASVEIDCFRGSSEGQWLAWLQTLVTGHAAKLRRHHTAAKRHPRNEADVASTIVVDLENSPVGQLMDGEQAARVASAIERLPAPMRMAIVNRVVLGQSWDEVATELGKSTGAARVLWTRAIRRLRENLEPS